MPYKMRAKCPGRELAATRTRTRTRSPETARVDALGAVSRATSAPRASPRSTILVIFGHLSTNLNMNLAASGEYYSLRMLRIRAFEKCLFRPIRAR
jgi:hypothetical protein